MATVVADQLEFDFWAPAVEARCARCRATLLASDVRGHRHYCGACRPLIAAERAAERDYVTAPRPPSCSCSRPFVVADDGQARCVKCGRVAG